MKPGTIARAALLLLLISVFAYLPVLGHGFFVDDDVYVGARNRVLPTLGITQLWRLLVERGNSWEFLPVRDFTYWLDMNLIGYDANAFHIGNLFWYLLCCYGVYRLTMELLLLLLDVSKEQSAMLAMIAALFFFLHPAHVEAVAWISGRKDILACGLFSLGAAAYVRGLRRSWSLGHFAVSTAFFVAAVFSKSVAVFALLPLPLLAINVRRWGERAPTRCFALYSVVPLVIALVALYVHLLVGTETGIGVRNSPELIASIERASRILTTLLGIVVLPTRLRLIYDVYALGAWHWLVSSLVVLIAAGAAFALGMGRRSLICVAVLFSIVPLMAYLQFSPFVTWSLASERFAFQATLGWVIVVVCLARMLSSEWRFACLLLLAAVFMHEVVVRTAQWESPRVLREYDVRAFPGHHSAAREFVIAHLLPEKDYPAAREVAALVRDASARDLLLKLIDADQAMQADVVDGARTNMYYPMYCAIAKTLDSDLVHAQRAARTALDITLTNYAGHLRAYLNQGIGNVSQVCGD